MQSKADPTSSIYNMEVSCCYGVMAGPPNLGHSLCMWWPPALKSAQRTVLTFSEKCLLSCWLLFYKVLPIHLQDAVLGHIGFFIFFYSYSTAFTHVNSSDYSKKNVAVFNPKCNQSSIYSVKFINNIDHRYRL